MEKSLILLFCLIVIATPVVHGVAQGPKAVEKWFENLSHAKEKVTKLRFYFHDRTAGKGQTSEVVGQANINFTSPALFGLVMMTDAPLTVGPKQSSKLVGRSQGLYGSASHTELGLAMLVNFVFTDGAYNGSTLAVVGHNPTPYKYRELSIVGGSGIFRLARGVVTFYTYFYDRKASYASVEVNVVAIHY